MTCALNCDWSIGQIYFLHSDQLLVDNLAAMNIFDEATDLIKWRSVEKSMADLRNNSPVYLNPGFSENNFGLKSKNLSPPTKQSPLEMLFETCKNIGHTLGLDEPVQTRKRSQPESKDEECGVSSRKKQNISPISHRSKSPYRGAAVEERKHLKPITNSSVRTTPDSSGSPRIMSESDNHCDRQSRLIPSSNLVDNPLSLYQSLLPHGMHFHKNLSIDALLNYHGIFNIPPTIESPHQRSSCECFLCVLLAMKPLLSDSPTFPFASKINLLPCPSPDPKVELLLASLYGSQSPMSIEYCMYCGLHCPSLQILLHHIHQTHML